MRVGCVKSALSADGTPIGYYNVGAGPPLLEAIDVLSAEGLPAERQVMCHLDFVPDLDYYRQVASRGAYFEFSRMGREYYEDTAGFDFGKDSTRIALIKQLMDEGTCPSCCHLP
jgi:predicted metal-dependent phosphotriesterase family hydrolase